MYYKSHMTCVIIIMHIILLKIFLHSNTRIWIHAVCINQICSNRWFGHIRYSKIAENVPLNLRN